MKLSTRVANSSGTSSYDSKTSQQKCSQQRDQENETGDVFKGTKSNLYGMARMPDDNHLELPLHLTDSESSATMFSISMQQLRWTHLSKIKH